MKKITFLFFIFLCTMPKSFGQFTEGFESGIPATWTVISGGDVDETWVALDDVTEGFDFARTGDKSASILYSADAHDDYLVTQAITVTAGVNDKFWFWARSFDPNYPEEFDVLLSTTTPTATAFTVNLGTVAPASGYIRYVYDLSTYVGQTIYIAMHSTTTNQFRIAVDDVVSGTNPPGVYCTSFPTSVDGDGITNITIGTTDVPNTPVTYSDFTSTVTNFGQGQNANLVITFDTGYTYDTNVWIDFNDDFDFDDAGELVKTGIASTDDTPAILDASFIIPVSAPLGPHRMRIGAADDGQVPPDPCYSDIYGVTIDFTANITAPVLDTPDYANLQFPYTATIAAGGTVNVYGQVYEGGLTDVAPNIAGQAPGISAWVGYSTTNTNPNTWTNWIPATWNSSQSINPNNDEYQAALGASLAPGTYYYATRFTLNGGPYVYGGTNNGFWDGTTHTNGVLTVNPPPPVEPNCDLSSSLPDDSLGGDVWTRPLASGAALSTVGVDVSYHIYGPLTVDTTGSYTFSSTQDFDGVIFLYQNSFDPQDQLTNYVAGNDDGTTANSEFTATMNVGTTYYYVTTSFAPGDFGNFSTVITGDGIVSCNALAVPGFNDNNFTYYPNPVKNILNLSYNQEISNVEVFNLLGQKVISNTINANSVQIDMSSLSKGAYMVRVTSNDQSKTIKVIKE